MLNIRYAFIIGFLLLISPKANSQFNPDTLSRKLDQVFLRDSLPGMMVVLVDKQGITYQKSFGFANVQDRKPYTLSTIQNLGSVSKTFIAIALMRAIELKYFTLETDINDILPFKVINPNHPNDRITIRELANHTSGIIDNPKIYPNSYKFYPDLRPYDSAALDAMKSAGYRGEVTDNTMKDFFYDYLAPKGKYYSSDNFGKGEAGSTSSYSNIGSALVAYLIELKSGLTYDEFAKKYILKPLKMNSSGWLLSDIDLKRHARLYYDKTLYFPLYNLLTYPDGGLKSSAGDLSKYLVGVINGYDGDQKLLSPESYKLMFTPQFSKEHPPKDISLTTRNKGIFWNLYTNGTIGHDGDDPGVSTFLFFNPATGTGGFFLCNRYLPDKTPVINLLVQATQRSN